MSGLKAIVDNLQAAISALDASIRFGGGLGIRPRLLARDWPDQAAIPRAEMIRFHNIVQMEAQTFSSVEPPTRFCYCREATGRWYCKNSLELVTPAIAQVFRIIRSLD